MKQTPNGQCARANIEWLGVCEHEAIYGRGSPTSNVQRSTLNAQSREAGRFDLEDWLLDFSARIIRLVNGLPNTGAANHIAGQLLRCGTSPYANHGEVEAAESRKDFVHKLRVCLKELKETRRWLALTAKSGMLPGAKVARFSMRLKNSSKFSFQASERPKGM